jgi:hypothetical protein
MMRLKRLSCLAALGVAACAPALAADAPLRSGPGIHRPGRAGGLAWGLAPGVGQLGAAGFGYYHTDDCWAYQPTFDGFDNYLGERRVNICLASPAN